MEVVGLCLVLFILPMVMINGVCLPKCRYSYSQVADLYVLTADGSENWLSMTVIECKTEMVDDAKNCHFDVASMLETETKPEIKHLFVFVLECQTPVRLIFENNSTNLRYKKVVTGLQVVRQCELSIEDISVWGKLTDFRFLSIMANARLLQGNTHNDYNLANFQNIDSLILESNDADIVHTLISQHFWPKMAKIVLSNQSIDTIDEQFKINMPLLQSLELPYNKLTRPPEFPWTSQTIMNIPRNVPRILSYEHFKSNNGVILELDVYHRSLNLDFNQIKDLSSHRFSGFLHKMSIQGNGLRKIGEDTFRHLKGVQSINLGSNSLKDIPENFLSGLESLVRLDLQHNMISLLPRNTFTNKRLLKLKFIYLTHNLLTVVQQDLFYGLQELEVLHLENNNIRTIEERSFFQNSTKLKEVHLQHNQLKQIPAWVFLLPSAQSIDLSRNLITYQNFYNTLDLLDLLDLQMLSYQHRHSSRAKIKLSLAGNSIIYFSVDGFNKTYQAKLNVIFNSYTIDLSENPLNCGCVTFRFAHYLRNLTDKDRPDLQIEEYQFKTWECATPANIQGKSILSLQKESECDHQFLDCPKLCKCRVRATDNTIIIYCKGRSLTDMPKSLPSGLIELHLEHNYIETVRPFAYLGNITKLYLSYNTIKHLNRSSLSLLTHLKELYIDSNKLTRLPLAITKLNLSILTLKHNFFECDCKDLWLKRWLLNNTDIILDIEQVLCNARRSRGVPVIQVPDKDFVCKNTATRNSGREFREGRDFGAGAICTVTLLIICICVMVMLYVYREELKVFIYTHSNWHPFDRVDDSDSSKIYDAFVSYNSHDERWVYGTLREVLETRDPPYRLCLHERDFVVGASIQENISHSVQQSKRMIMVLSQHFLQSDWCMLEFRAAHHKLLRDRTQYLIIILMEDVRMSELDDELKLYMRTNTYLSVGNKWFWQRLLYAMPQISSKSNSLAEVHTNDQFEYDLENPSTASISSTPHHNDSQNQDENHFPNSRQTDSTTSTSVQETVLNDYLNRTTEKPQTGNGPAFPAENTDVTIPLPDPQYYSGDSWGCSVDSKGYSIDSQGYSIDSRGYSADSWDCSLDSKGYSVDSLGYSVNSQRYSVVSQGCGVDSQGHSVDSQGYSADSKCYSADSQGYCIDSQGCSVGPQQFDQRRVSSHGERDIKFRYLQEGITDSRVNLSTNDTKL